MLNVLEKLLKGELPSCEDYTAITPQSARPRDGAFPTGTVTDGPPGVGGSNASGA